MKLNEFLRIKRADWVSSGDSYLSNATNAIKTLFGKGTTANAMTNPLPTDRDAVSRGRDSVRDALAAGKNMLGETLPTILGGRDVMEADPTFPTAQGEDRTYRVNMPALGFEYARIGDRALPRKRDLGAFEALTRKLRSAGLTSRELATSIVPSLMSSAGMQATEKDPRLLAPTSLNINPKDTVVSTHEYGHVNDYDKNRGTVYTRLGMKLLPGLNHVATLWAERNANKESWKLLQKAYKDNPEVLAKFKELRSKALPKAYATYLNASAIPLATSAGGAFLGDYFARRSTNKSEEKLQKIINSKKFQSLEPWQQEKVLKKYKYLAPSKTQKLLKRFGYGFGGALLGDIIGSKIPSPFTSKVNDTVMNYMDSDEYHRGLDDLNRAILRDAGKDPKTYAGGSAVPAATLAFLKGNNGKGILGNMLSYLGGWDDKIDSGSTSNSSTKKDNKKK